MGKFIICFAAVLLTSHSHQNEELQRSTRFADFNMYFTYSRANPSKYERIYATTASATAQRNFRNQVVVIVHDHGGSATTGMNPTLKDAFLTSEDLTVIVVDWSFVAGQSYENAVGAAPSIGSGIFDLLRFLITANRVSLDRLHLVGHGLGAHIVAFAARELKTWRGEVARITGLDPVANQWGSNSARLRPDDAAYVEVIHTDITSTNEGTAIGISVSLGAVDFYPNGGTRHPGCNNNHECNHNRAWEFFAASLTHKNLVGNQCLRDAVEYTDTNCRGFTLALGNNEKVKYGSGNFYLETGQKYPYDNPLNSLLPCIP